MNELGLAMQMMMSKKMKMGCEEKVVMIVTGMEMRCLNAKWMMKLQGLPLKAGDELILLALLQHIHFSPPHTYAAAARLFGYKGKDDPTKVYGSDKRILENELRKRKEEYGQNAGLMQLQKLYEIEKGIVISVEVEAGSSRKAAVVSAAKRLSATWIILDREMKKEKQYFVDKLSCRISSIKSNNSVVELRSPIIKHVTYSEMIPSYSWEEQSPSSKASAKEAAHSTTSLRLLDTISLRVASDSNSMKTKHVRFDIQDGENNGIGKQTIGGKSMSSFHSIGSSKECQNEECRPAKNPILQQALNLEEVDRKWKWMDKGKRECEFENSVCSVCKNRRPKICLQRDFSYGELHEATDGFSERNYLSEGGFGFVFQGRLKDGLKIAVKRHKTASLQGEKEFKSEVRLLSQARHQNLVMLLGSCTQGRHRLLVYEYVCNGSLDKHLSDDCSAPLNWEKRIKIALGAAKGLEYLHARNIVHRDMRPSNILITHDYESLLGDFGLAKEHRDDSVQSLDKGVVGTFGYVAPEYAESGKMSTKTDVYSFGVVLLQLITGLRTTDEIPGGKGLVGWAKPLLESKNYPDLIDRNIVDSHDVLQLFWMVRVAEDCLKKDPRKRCTMKLVVHNLSCIKEGKTDFIRDF